MARAETLGYPAIRGAVIIRSPGLRWSRARVCSGRSGFGAGPLAYSFFPENGVGLQAAGVAAGLLVLPGLMEFLAAPSSTAAGLLHGQRETSAPLLYTLIGHGLVGPPLGFLPSIGRQRPIHASAAPQ